MSLILGGAPDAGRRFLRDERTVNDFVGTNSADAGATGFVGGVSAVNSAVSSVTGLTEQVRVPINRPKVNRPQVCMRNGCHCLLSLKQSPLQLRRIFRRFACQMDFRECWISTGSPSRCIRQLIQPFCADRFLPNGIARRSTPRDARTRDSNDPKRVDGGFRRFNLVL